MQAPQLIYERLSVWVFECFQLVRRSPTDEKRIPRACDRTPGGARARKPRSDAKKAGTNRGSRDGGDESPAGEWNSQYIPWFPNPVNVFGAEERGKRRGRRAGRRSVPLYHLKRKKGIAGWKVATCIRLASSTSAKAASIHDARMLPIILNNGFCDRKQSL